MVSCAQTNSPKKSVLKIYTVIFWHSFATIIMSRQCLRQRTLEQTKKFCEFRDLKETVPFKYTTFSVKPCLKLRKRKKITKEPGVHASWKSDESWWRLSTVASPTWTSWSPMRMRPETVFPSDSDQPAILVKNHMIRSTESLTFTFPHCHDRCSVFANKNVSDCLTTIKLQSIKLYRWTLKCFGFTELFHTKFESARPHQCQQVPKIPQTPEKSFFSFKSNLHWCKKRNAL